MNSVLLVLSVTYLLARHKQERASAGFQQLIRGAAEEQGIARSGGDAQNDQGVAALCPPHRGLRHRACQRS